MESLETLIFITRQLGLWKFWLLGCFFQIRLTSASCPTFFPELRIAREFRKKLPCKGYGMFWKRGIVEAFGITGLNP